MIFWLFFLVIYFLAMVHAAAAGNAIFAFLNAALVAWSHTKLQEALNAKKS